MLTGNADPQLRKQIERRLTDVVNLLGSGNLAAVRSDFTDSGYEAATTLLAKVQIENAEFTHLTELLKRDSDRRYEVRDIHVHAVMNGTSGDPNQYLVFILDRDGRIDDMLFSMEPWNYRDVKALGKQLNDMPLCERIINFLEIYRTAYNRKDLSYLRQVYSEDALIIVGHDLHPKPDAQSDSEILRTAKWNSERFEFLAYSKSQYLSHLANVFKQNSFVRVEFDSIKIEQKNDIPHWYGVNLKQHWYSSNYSDTGYIFLMLNFSNPNEPEIRVRCWQPRPFDDGKLPSVSDFIVVDVGNK
jgi:hypothetical protein